MADKNNTLVPRMESIILTSRALAGLSLPCMKRGTHHRATQLLRSTCHSEQRKQAIRDRQLHLFHQTNAPVFKLPTILSKALSRKHTTLIACSASPRPQRAMLWITQKSRLVHVNQVHIRTWRSRGKSHSQYTGCESGYTLRKQNTFEVIALGKFWRSIFSYNNSTNQSDSLYQHKQFRLEQKKSQPLQN